MYLLGVLCMAGLTVALPVVPDVSLPSSVTAALQDQVYIRIIKIDPASSTVKDPLKEVKANIVKFYPVFIPPPPELPPFDYSSLPKQKVHKSKSNNTIQSEAERYFEKKVMKPFEKSVEVLEKSKPIEDFKSEEKLQPIEEAKSIENSKSPEEEEKKEERRKEKKPIEEPNSIEEFKSVEEPVPREEPKSVEEHKSVERFESSKVLPKEEPEKPLADIPVVVQFSIPTPFNFLSSIISKLPSLPSLSWPFHIPSIFNRPRVFYPNYDDDEIYPY